MAELFLFMIFIVNQVKISCCFN